MPSGRLIPALLVLMFLSAGTVTAFVVAPRRDVTTRSDRAYGYYCDGLHAMRKYYEKEARDTWLLALDEDPEFAMALVRLARISLVFGDPAAARGYYDRAAAQAGRVTERERLQIELLGADLEGQKQRRAAIESELIRRFPDDAEIVLLAGNRALDAHRPSEALDHFRSVLARAPAMGEVYNSIGYACSELGRWEEAVEAFQKYAFLYPDQANPHDSLGELYLRLGRYEDALVEFDKAIDIKPDFAWAHYHQSLTLAQLGRFEAALVSLRRAWEPNPTGQDAPLWRRHQVLLALQAGRPAEAGVGAREFRRDFPGDPAGFGLMARWHLACGRPDAADAAIDSARALAVTTAAATGADTAAAAHSALLLELRAEAAAARGDWPGAARLFAEAADAGGSWIATRRLVLREADAELRAGRPAETLARLEPWLSVNPRDPEVNRLAGVALERLGRPADAEARLERSQQTLAGADRPVDG